jgi:hypothetical protein
LWSIGTERGNSDGRRGKRDRMRRHERKKEEEERMESTP